MPIRNIQLNCNGWIPGFFLIQITACYLLLGPSFEFFAFLKKNLIWSLHFPLQGITLKKKIQGPVEKDIGEKKRRQFFCRNIIILDFCSLAIKIPR
jgi:hypothetical protein